MFRSTISPTTARCRLGESFGHNLPAGRSLSPVDPCHVPSCVALYHDGVAKLPGSTGALAVAGAATAPTGCLCQWSRSTPTIHEVQQIVANLPGCTKGTP